MSEAYTAARFKEEGRAALAEFFACCFFVFFGAGSVVGALSATGDAGPVEPVNYALSFGFSITVLAFCIGDVSGGHINPAVTVTLAVTRNITVSRAVFYIAAQIAGGIVGGGFLFMSVEKGSYASGIGLASDITPFGGFWLEMMGTLLLLFTVYNVAVWSGKPLEHDLAGSTISALAPLPIGLAVMVSHLTLGPLTGCGINPARVIGAVVWEDEAWWKGRTGEHFWIYMIGPLVAALIAPLTYAALYGTVSPGSAGKEHPEHAKEYKDDPNKVVPLDGK
jgi:aquaporin PIP